MQRPGRRTRRTASQDAHGWIRLEPVLVTERGDRLLIDAVVVDAVVLDAPVLGAPRHPGDPVPGIGSDVGRGTPLALSLWMGGGTVELHGRTGSDRGAAGPADLVELAEAVREADMIHVFRDEAGTALVLRRGPAWWYLEVD